MEPHDIERLRRSVAMLPPGHSAGALTRDAALEMLEELQRLDRLTARYKQLIGQLRQILSTNPIDQIDQRSDRR